MDDTGTRVAGQIASVVYSNDDTGYAVVKLRGPDAESVTLVGTLPHPAPGEQLEAQGAFTTHAQYGRQFKADHITRTLPMDVEAICEYLSARVVPGIGPVLARRLVDAFGAETLTVLAESPDKLSKIPGISPKRARSMSAAFASQNAVRRLMAFLSEHALPLTLTMPLYKQFGDGAVSVLRDNPYVLTEEPFAAPFAQADRLAVSLGFAGGDLRRVQAAILFELRVNMEDGHAYLPAELLIDVVCQLIDVHTQDVQQALTALLETDAVVVETHGERELVYLRALFEAECAVRDGMLMRLVRARAPARLSKLIEQVETDIDLQLAPKQREALALAASTHVMVLTGGPGTGKTTTLRALLTLFDRLGLDTALAAPTGRAAKRMSELTGREAKTIHRLLEVDFDPETGLSHFIHNHETPLNCDAVIIDEMSMVDLLLMHALIDALQPGTRLILVGDPDQLPSVGAGHVLHDLIASRKLPVICLQDVFRQAQESHIVTIAHAIRVGEVDSFRLNEKDMFFLSRQTPEAALSTILELAETRLPQNLGIPNTQIQILSPTRKGMLGTRSLNDHLQARLNPKHPDRPELRFGEQIFRVGDRVMQIQNNYDLLWKRDDGASGLGVFNGDVGQIEQLDLLDQMLTVRFDDRTARYPLELLPQLEPAYAMTVHKAQGSEYEAVILTAMPGPAALLTRRVLYTAVTRACRYLIVVGREDVLRHMLQNNRDRRRYSGLARRLRDAHED